MTQTHGVLRGRDRARLGLLPHCAQVPSPEAEVNVGTERKEILGVAQRNSLGFQTSRGRCRIGGRNSQRLHSIFARG